jgi:ketosteroid isomerase-like protein
MSANLDLVRSIHALWSRGDFSAADWAHPDIEFAIPDGPEPFSVSGVDAMGRAWRGVLSAWANYRVSAEEYRELADGQVLVLTRYSAHGKVSGMQVEEISTSGANLLRIRNRKVVRLIAYWDRDRALSDLGLEETAVSRGNVEIVRSVYRSWNRGEIPGPAHLFDNTVEYVNPSGAIEPGNRCGIEAFTRAVSKTFESWEKWETEPREFRTRGENVAVALRFTARGRGSRLEMEGSESALWTIRDGKVVRYEWFHNPADAFKAVAREE